MKPAVAVEEEVAADDVAMEEALISLAYTYPMEGILHGAARKSTDAGRVRVAKPTFP